MKQYFLILATSMTLLSACGEKKKTEASTTPTSTESTTTTSSESSDEKTGEFSIDGTNVSGKVETQYFGDKEKGNFSVLCQHNEGATSANFELLQATFVNEKDATTNPNLKIYSGSSLPMTEPEPGIVAVALSGVGGDLGDKEYTGTSKSTGSITISNKVLTIKDLTLYNSDGKMKTVNAKIPF
jgi:hypothetical protein